MAHITELFYEGISLDLYADKNLKYTLQVNDLAEVKDRQASFTDAYDLPKTPKNIQALRGLGLPSDTSREPYRKPSCQIKIDGFDFVVNGWIKIKETDEDFKVAVFSGIINFFKAIENKTLGTDLDLSEINHDKTVPVVKASQLNPFYKYLIADYNGKTHYGTDDLIVNIDYLIPSANIKYLWDKVFERFGFEYTGSIFDSSDFLNLWITYPKGILDTDTTPVENRTGSINYTQSSPYMTGMGEFGDHLTIIQSGKYQFGLTFTLSGISNVTLSGNPLKFQIWRNSVKEWEESATANGVYNLSALINYNTGDDLYFRWGWEVPGNYALTIDYDIDTAIFNVANYSFNEEFKDFQITDFVKEIFNRFALTPFADEFTNIIDFRLLTERIKAEKIVDWSAKYIERTGESYLFDDYAKENIFSYQYNDKESTHSNGSIYINNQNLKESKKVYESKTYSPEKDFAPYQLGASTVNVRTFKIYDKDIKEKNGVQEISYKGLDKRFHFIKATAAVNSFQIGTELLGEDETATDFFMGEFSDQDWQSLINKFYPDLKALLNDSRIHSIDLYLDMMDLLLLDLKAIYYFEQEQQYYILNKLSFDDDRAKGDFIRINSDTETVIPEEPSESPILKISWMDGLSYPLTGTASSIDMQISQIYSPAEDPILSVEWQKLAFSWTDLGTGVTPYTATLVDGVNRYRLKGTLTTGQIVSNELQYTKIVLPPCLRFRFGYTGTAPGQDGSVIYKDCDNLTRQADLTWEESDGRYYEIELCALSIINLTGFVTDVTNYGDQPPC